jgi:tetratricopeptide (TPR) repeat protein
LSRLTDTDGAIRLGEARYRTGTWAEAAAIFARIEQDPEHSPALRLLGLCRLRLGEPAGALALLERAYALAPADPFAQLHLGLGLHAFGRNAAAALFRRCQPLLPDDPARVTGETVVLNPPIRPCAGRRACGRGPPVASRARGRGHTCRTSLARSR